MNYQDKVIAIISELTKIEHSALREREASTNLWDSFTNVELVLRIEEEFNIEFTQTELEHFNSVRSISEVLEKKFV
jgi:acyl carrier protein